MSPDGGAGVMSQRVKITRARVHGGAVYLGDVTGPDGTAAPVWSADPGEVLGRSYSATS
jgi:hypothetical protein